jgi:site-specific DNA-methyltransferase (adenine-specific)
MRSERPATRRAGPAQTTRERSVEQKFLARDRAWAQRPRILRNQHQIHRTDARSLDAIAEPESVHLVVTSPPYWNLKRYPDTAGDAQLGNIDSREDFLEELAKVWSHCHRALVPGGRLCIVVGDVCRSRRGHGRHVVEPLHAYLQVQCQDMGFDPLAPIIWHKIANMTTEVAGNGSGFLGKPYEPNAIIKNDIEFILLFRKPGAYRHPTQEQRDLSLISKDDHRRWFRQIWSDVPGDSQREHPAPFPSEIARRLIGMFSFVGDTVLDPFWGIGNTTLAAIEMHRSSIGTEIEPGYIGIGRRRVGTPPLESTLEFIDQGSI